MGKGQVGFPTALLNAKTASATFLLVRQHLITVEMGFLAVSQFTFTRHRVLDVVDSLPLRQSWQHLRSGVKRDRGIHDQVRGKNGAQTQIIISLSLFDLN